MILRNVNAMMTKAQNRYASAVNKKRREITFQVGEKVWLDSRNLGIPTELSIKWSARWVGPLSVKKILHPDVYVLDLGIRVGKSWHPVFHVSLLKKYYRDKNDLHWWQKYPRRHPNMSFGTGQWARSRRSSTRDRYTGEANSISAWCTNVRLMNLNG